LVIDAISDGSSSDSADRSADQSAGKAVVSSAIVADNRAGERPYGATRDSSLLGVGARAYATRAKGG
jgi:hypothetical protein